MARACEICTSLTQSTGALVTSQQSAVYRVIMPERVLSLCSEHAGEVEATRALSLGELRRSFLEPFPGQRSLIPRRSPSARDAADADRRGVRGRRVGD